MSKVLWVFDIDMTLADGTRRHAKAGPEPDRKRDMDAHNEWIRTVMTNTVEDPPVPELMVMARRMISDNVFTPTILVTARNNNLRMETVDWLKRVAQIGIMPPLHMRGSTDYRRSGDIKREVIKQAAANCEATSVVVVDDDERDELPQICREEGWLFLKAYINKGPKR